MTWQPSLLDLDEPTATDPALSGRQRIRLDARSWLDLLPGWVRGGDALLEHLTAEAPWLPQRTVQMWDSHVAEPRIVAQWPDLATLPPAVEGMRAAVSAAYATDFDLVAVNLYRDGRDSVAWHGDRVRHTHGNALRRHRQPRRPTAVLGAAARRRPDGVRGEPRGRRPAGHGRPDAARLAARGTEGQPHDRGADVADLPAQRPPSDQRHLTEGVAQ